ncbi:MAG: rane-associated phosphatase, like Aur1 family, and protein serine/threonine/tyrosine [Phycisphaerales bacterium]|nr:rane-associated phosphatase, like Aur1 family, and protein serine/threonine/tyrosine [Phycisphaerales bacterium]
MTIDSRLSTDRWFRWRTWAAARPLAEAGFWAVFLSIFFFAVYATTNWLAGHRANVGTLYFPWESRIPFVPAMIVPYMSIDLFFFFAPFLCTDVRELRTHARRVMLAILIAGAFFLLLPLQFGMQRPDTPGALGGIFRFLYGFDRPVNLVPSLHIALRWLAWAIFARHTFGLLRRSIDAWFILIGLSTLLTWQHHVIDIVTGQMLAAFCFYVFPSRASEEERTKYLHPRPPRNSLAGALYLLGAVLFLVAAVAWRPWGFLLLWYVLALTIMSAAYFSGREGVFRKSRGRLPLSTHLVLLPYLLSDRLFFLSYRRGSKPYDQIAPGLIVGRWLSHREARALLDQGVTAVLDLSAEYAESPPLRGVVYRSVPVLDLTAPSVSKLREAVKFIRTHAPGGTVYVHCKMGFSRSACAAAAYLLAEGIATNVEDAMNHVRRARPQARLGRHAAAVLADYHSRGDL